VTGHSLGGALASLAAGSLAQQGIYPSANIRLYTFGQPRTGNVAYAQAIEHLVPEAYRVVHSHDIVPHVPPQGFEGYRHHKTEVWYNNNAMTPGSSYKICSTDTVLDCSNTNVFNLSTDDHLHYFNVLLSGLCPNPVPSAP
ncbi:Protein F25A2.1, partial [Aphelenchoides avenae]